MKKLNILPVLKFPTIYDNDSLNCTEMTIKVYNAMRELQINYEKFKVGSIEYQKEYKHQLVKITQNFINSIDMKMDSQNLEVDNAVEYMTTNISNAITELLTEMKNNGELDEILLNALNNIESRVSTLEQGKVITDEIIESGGLDRIKATGKFLTNSNSWIGYMNTKYDSDNATRWYLIPRDKVTTGVGGCLKIFADNYFENQDYRDLGIYFSANQNGDTGYYGNGVNWINVKVLDGGQYQGKHPDLGFCFQDGNVVAGRITCYGNQRAMWVFGSGISTLQGTDLIAEFQKSIGFTKGSRIRFENDKDLTKFNDVFSDSDGNLNYSISSLEKKFIGGTQTEENSINTTNIKNALITTNRVNVNSATTSINVINSNRVVIGNTDNSTISTITGVDGQELIIISASQGTTIENNTSIHLQNNTNYTMTMNSTLTLVNVNGTWYEKCRSVNS